MDELRTNKFIVIEGPDGSGKTTQTQLIAKYLTSIGRQVVTTSEPSNSSISTLIRPALKKPSNVFGCSHYGTMDKQALALLFAADRLVHWKNEISPALELGRDVICDRYVLSSLAYQGLDCPLSWLASINGLAALPDKCFYLDTDIDDCFARISARSEQDIYETKEMLTKIKSRYVTAMAYVKCIIIDASGTPEQVAQRIITRLEI